MTDLKIDLDLSPALNALDDLRRSQLPFATALALTNSARFAQREIRQALPHRFEIRSPFIERGVRIETASKANLEAAVLWRAPGGPDRRGFAKYLARQETGGITQPTGRYTALPRRVKRGATGLIGKANRPAALLKRRNVFVQDDGKNAAIYQRVGKKAPPRLLYYLTEKPARYRPRWEFRETAVAAVRRVWRREFGKAFAKAIATRRR